MRDLPSPSDELALRLLERWITVVRADTTRSLLHGPKRRGTKDRLDQTVAALKSIENDRALAKFVTHTAPRWKAQLIASAMIDLVGALGNLPSDDPLRAELRKQLDQRVSVARIAERAVRHELRP